jgi:hypothetical protein
MAKSSELLALKLRTYRIDASGQIFVRSDDGNEFLVECDRCGNTKDWLIAPGPKEALTIICNSCIITYVYIMRPVD